MAAVSPQVGWVQVRRSTGFPTLIVSKLYAPWLDWVAAVKVCLNSDMDLTLAATKNSEEG